MRNQSAHQDHLHQATPFTPSSLKRPRSSPYDIYVRSDPCLPTPPSSKEDAGYLVDLDATHRVLRITVTTALTDETCRNVYRAVARFASRGGPYAAIMDLSQVVDFPLSANTIRDLATSAPAVPGGRLRVIVARQPALYGLARMFELRRDSMGGQLQVVQALDEAYDLLQVTPQDFSQRLFPETAAP
jgi:hypothetical protein